MLAPFTGLLVKMVDQIYFESDFFCLVVGPRFLPWIILGSKMSLCSIGVACAKGMRSPWTIFFSIVRLSAPYGMRSSVALNCLRLCLVGWLICLLACWWTGGRS
jgi:hypothetical protein